MVSNWSLKVVLKMQGFLASMIDDKLFPKYGSHFFFSISYFKDQYANAFLHDDNMNFRVNLHRMVGVTFVS